MSTKDLQKAEEQGLLEFFKLTSKLTTTNMICFDFDGKIKKYDSPEEIIEDFYPVRLSYYQKRKASSFLLHLPQTYRCWHTNRTTSLLNWTMRSIS